MKTIILSLLSVLFLSCMADDVYDFYQVGNIEQSIHSQDQAGYKLNFSCMIYNNTDAVSVGNIVFETPFGKESKRVVIEPGIFTKITFVGKKDYPFPTVEIKNVHYENQ